MLFPYDIQFMRTITFLAFETMCKVSKDNIISLLTIFALRNTRVHVGSSDSSDIIIYIETSVNETFSFCTILRIPNINPNNSYIRFRRHVNDVQMRY